LFHLIQTAAGFEIVVKILRKCCPTGEVARFSAKDSLDSQQRLLSFNEKTKDWGNAMEARELRHRLDGDNMAPLWEVLRGLTPREPRKVIDSTVWRAETIRANMAIACESISAEDAERRVLVLENKRLRGRSMATNSLYAGIQMILPGETAPSHRHTASALRLILAGEGGFTTVDGEKVIMSKGDFIITPADVFHDHGAEGSDPVMWLDGLDVPIVQLLNAGFSADDTNRRQGLKRPVGDAIARYASGLTPAGYVAGATASPLFHYPYARAKAALIQLAQADEWDAAEALKLRYTDPTTGRSPIASMAAFLQLFPAGFHGLAYRETDASVACIVEGKLRVTIGGEPIELREGDVFVLPGWEWKSFEADESCVLFSFSDRPLQESLGFWRSEKAAA
jgi:gentisate 1,2-dioxygenase